MRIQFLSGPYEGRTLPVDISEPIIFGRQGNAPLPDTRASRQHARLSLQLGKWTLEDLSSRNGTFLNQKRLTSPVIIKEGDTIEIGRSTFVIRDIAAQKYDGAILKAPNRSLEASADDGAIATMSISTATAVAGPTMTSAPADDMASSGNGVAEAIEPEPAGLGELPDSTPWGDDALAAEWPGLAAAETPTAEGIDDPISSNGEAVELQDVEAQHQAHAVDAIPEEPAALNSEFSSAESPTLEIEAAGAEQPGESDASMPQLQMESPPGAALADGTLSTIDLPTMEFDVEIPAPAEVELPRIELDVTEDVMDSLDLNLPQATLEVDVPGLESSASDIPEVSLEVDSPEAVLASLDAPEVALEVDASAVAASFNAPELEIDHDIASSHDESLAVAESTGDSLMHEASVEATVSQEPVVDAEAHAVDVEAAAETSDVSHEMVAVEGVIAQPIFSDWDVHEGEIAGTTGAFDNVALSAPVAAFADDDAVIHATNLPTDATLVESSSADMSTVPPKSLGDNHAGPVGQDTNPSRADAADAEPRRITPSLTELKRTTPTQGIALAARDSDPLAPYPWPPQTAVAPVRRVWPYVLLVAILIAVLANVALLIISQRQMRNEVVTLRSVLEENEQATAELLIDEIRRELRERPQESSAQSLTDLNAALAQQTAASERAARELAEQLERGQASESALEQQRSSQAASDVSRVLAELDGLKQSINKLSGSTALAAAPPAQTAASAATTTESPQSNTEAAVGSSVVEKETQPFPVANQRVPEAPVPVRDETNAAVQAKSQVTPAAAASPAVVYFIDASNALKSAVPEAMAEVRRLMKQTRGRDASAIFMLYGNRLVQVNDPAATDMPASEPNGDDIVDLGKMDLKQALEKANEARPRTLHLLSDTLGNTTAMRDALNDPSLAGTRVHVVQFYSRKSQDVLKSIAREHNGYYTHVSPAE